MTRLRRSAVASVALLALAACSGDQTTSPLTFDPLFNSGDSDAPAEVELCKQGPSGTTATFTVTQSPTGVGTLLVTNPFTLEATDGSDLTKCRVIWRATSSSQPSTTLTVTETGSSTGTVLNSIVVIGGAGSPTVNLTNQTASVPVNFTNGAYIIFKNIFEDTPPPPPPPPGGRGCTPGYWKVKPHLDSWPATGYTTGQSFQSAFGVNAFPGMTLHQVLSQGGGGLTALGRHAVAALLNSAHPGVPYNMTTAQVISAFQNAYSTGHYEATKAVFETLNELGCSIN